MCGGGIGRRCARLVTFCPYGAGSQLCVVQILTRIFIDVKKSCKEIFNAPTLTRKIAGK